ncbi:hypothetical protein [Flavobacterium okayamense]|uniref:Self-protective colicin-like immunity n=1 Tax=Flavobacterium okayamense TaxID=2830782 RepID=A0ABN6HTW0_9FLAO|nr:hypothetical protein [Flavobacterium okayamense]BCY27862.1 hypothetical protein KK2020170_07300 [Flavobacterium okayamense]
MKKEHNEIINLISDYLNQHPDQRFGQAIFNIGINEFLNKVDPEKDDFRIRDIYNDQDSDIINRIKSQLEWFEKQKNDKND